MVFDDAVIRRGKMVNFVQESRILVAVPFENLQQLEKRKALDCSRDRNFPFSEHF
jgi:hypothetical protein